MGTKSRVFGSIFLGVSLFAMFSAALASSHAASYVIKGKRYYPLAHVSKGYTITGDVSWYSVASNFGTATASGEKFKNNALTAASPVLPMGTHLRVTNMKNHRSVVVKVTDRGPYKFHRILDLSPAAAKKLGYQHNGTAHVKATVI